MNMEKSIIQKELKSQENNSIKKIVVKQSFDPKFRALNKKVYINDKLINGITDVKIVNKYLSNEVTLTFDCPNVSFEQEESLAIL